jgi:hypothetical protein
MNRDEFEQQFKEGGSALLGKMGEHIKAHPKGYAIALGLIVAFALGAFLF